MEVEIERKKMNRGDVANVRIFKAKKPGAVKAMASVTFANGMTLKGFKVISGSKGLFVGLPNVYNQKEEKWDTICFFTEKEDRDVLTEIVMESYKKEFSDSQNKQDQSKKAKDDNEGFSVPNEDMGGGIW